MPTNAQLGFHFDASKCSGCKTCHVICKSKFDAALTQTTRRVYEYVGGEAVINQDSTITNNVFAYYVSVGCNHCSEPVCVKACPTGACHKQQTNGLVKIDADICIGCASCSRACPYDAPQMDPLRKVMTKCDGCEEEWNRGELPRCVQGCPQRVLDYGPVDELSARHPNAERANIAPLPGPEITHPNLLITRIPLHKNSGSRAGTIENPTEV